MKNTLLSLFFILSSVSIYAQATTEIKLDILGITSKTLRVSVERRFTPKFGLDVGLAQTWSHLGVDRSTFFTTPIFIDSSAMNFTTRNTEVAIMANFFPFNKADNFVDFMVSPVARATWRTYVDPDYYGAYRTAFGREAPDPYLFFPEFTIGLAVGIEAEILPRITVEPSFSFEWIFSNWYRFKKAGFGRLDFVSYLSVKVGYVLQAKKE